MVLHGEETLKTTEQKNLPNLKNLQRKSLRRSFVIFNSFFLQFIAILLMIVKLMISGSFILKLHMRNLVEHLWWSFFAEIVNVLKPLIRRRATWWMFDRILNATLPRSEEKLSAVGVPQGNLGLPFAPNSLDLHQTQKQQDEILDSSRVFVSLSNTSNENIKNSSTM